LINRPSHDEQRAILEDRKTTNRRELPSGRVLRY